LEKCGAFPRFGSFILGQGSGTDKVNANKNKPPVCWTYTGSGCSAPDQLDLQKQTLSGKPDGQNARRAHQHRAAKGRMSGISPQNTPPAMAANTTVE
jgi:hypothetical protein